MMKRIINISDLLKHLSFWHNKTDGECIKLASNEYGIDAEEALLNMLERDFCTSVNNNIIKCLNKKNMNKGKEKAEVYSKENEFCFKIGWDVVRYNDYLAGYNEGFNDGCCEATALKWISIENEPEYLGKYLVQFDTGDIDVCWLSDKHGELNWYTHSECDIEFKIDGIKYYRTIDSL